jgi:RNA polymerase sigma factor (sigma-70 family)
MPTDEEARQLAPVIERIARQVANRQNASRTVRDELAGEVVGHVFSVIHTFDPSVAKFSTWCYAVVRNHCVTLIRQEARRRGIAEKARDAAKIDEERQLLEGPAPSPAEEREEAELRAGRPRFDLVPLLDAHLQPIDRLLLAGYVGLLSAVDGDVVDRWCRDAERPDAAGLTEIEGVPKSQRKQAMARILGEKLGWVRQRIFRAVQRLKQQGLEGQDL